MRGTDTLATSAQHTDARLRGRTYSIPFEDVWQGALRIIREKSKGWKLDLADDQEGVITAEYHAFIKKLNGRIEISIKLDHNGQTRVDAKSSTPQAFTDVGVNARRVDGFFRALDREADREWKRRLTITSPR